MTSPIEAAFLAACRQELEALKPGNVHIHAAGHGMTVADFFRSAEVSAPALCRPGAALGARIFDAVRATRDAVGQNTNLGILLLCAPLALAAERGKLDLRAAVREVLDASNLDDARAVFQAITLAAPGGLGEAPRHDVRGRATVSLRVAMGEAAGRDSIARQWTNDFADIFAAGLPAYNRALMRWRDPAWAAAELHVRFMAEFLDSHVVRKHGLAEAERTRAEAAQILMRMEKTQVADALAEFMSPWDASLKARGVNPGTSADLTVAALFAHRLASILRGPEDDGSVRPAYGRNEGGNAVATITKVCVGESLVGDGNEVAHVDLIMGPRGSAAESAFCHALTNNKDGFTSLLAVVAPNLLTKPNTILFNKVTIKGAKQAVQMFGPAQHAVAKAVADSVAEGVIPADEADDLFICVGVFIHWDAADDKKIQDYNYQATKELIARAIRGEPKASEVVSKRNTAKHPFAPN